MPVGKPRSEGAAGAREAAPGAAGATAAGQPRKMPGNRRPPGFLLWTRCLRVPLGTRFLSAAWRGEITGPSRPAAKIRAPPSLPPDGHPRPRPLPRERQEGAAPGRQGPRQALLGEREGRGEGRAGTAWVTAPGRSVREAGWAPRAIGVRPQNLPSRGWSHTPTVRWEGETWRAPHQLGSGGSQTPSTWPLLEPASRHHLGAQPAGRAHAPRGSPRPLSVHRVQDSASALLHLWAHEGPPSDGSHSLFLHFLSSLRIIFKRSGFLFSLSGWPAPSIRPSSRPLGQRLGGRGLARRRPPGSVVTRD